MTDPAVFDFVTLSLIRQLFDALHQHQINYCHWKNNPDHVRASFSGMSDVDILFDDHEKLKVEHLLQQIGFKKFSLTPHRKNDDIEDYFLLEFETGKLIHLHAHYRLIMEPLFSKKFQTGLEPFILENRVYLEHLGVFGSTPEIQLLILYLNESLKLRTRDKVMLSMRGTSTCSEKVWVEYQWLHNHVDPQALQKLLATVFGEKNEEVLQMMQVPFTKNLLLKFRSLVREHFSAKQIFPSWKANLLRWYNEGAITWRKLISRYNEPILIRRMNPRGGVVVAVVGADGSGKSTVTKDIEVTFGKKLDVIRIYFGRGDGRISFSRRALQKVKRIFLSGKNPGSIKNSIAEKKPKAYQNKTLGFVATGYKVLNALLVANEKRVNLARMNRARRMGMLVVCDRFPQNQIMGYNDGPLLQPLMYSRNPLFKWLALWESSIYGGAERTPPDLLIKLITEAAIVEQRKPGETEIEKLEAKIDGIRNLKMRGACTVLTIDAAQPLQKVLYQVREAIWDKL